MKFRSFREGVVAGIVPEILLLPLLDLRRAACAKLRDLLFRVHGLRRRRRLLRRHVDAALSVLFFEYNVCITRCRRCRQTFGDHRLAFEIFQIVFRTIVV